ncbi:MAG: NAD(P)-dependent oxidoreductase [Ktedonobacteraceae bacterium]|nr:NAD(P)-dependent oxidoreductase [Ktedonobacteraceae bacterium]
MSKAVGFIGLGNMGHPIAANLLKAGFRVHVYNRSAAKAKPLVEQGAHQVERPCDVVEPGGIVVSMVANDSALEDITLGEGGILERLGPDGIHISMSSVAPTTAEKMTDEHTKRGSFYVASPVFGRPDAATAAALWVCISGPDAAKERIRPVLEAVGQSIFDFGTAPGAANVVKVIGNFWIVAAMEAMAEGLTLAEKNGVERTKVIEMLSQTLFPGRIYQNYGSAIARKSYTPVGFEMKLGLKDINLALHTAEQSLMPMPLASLLHDRLQTGIAKGRGEMDWMAMSLGVSEDAGL